MACFFLQAFLGPLPSGCSATLNAFFSPFPHSPLPCPHFRSPFYFLLGHGDGRHRSFCDVFDFSPPFSCYEYLLRFRCTCATPRSPSLLFPPEFMVSYHPLMYFCMSAPRRNLLQSCALSNLDRFIFLPSPNESAGPLQRSPGFRP